jgi:hypothetical protein
MMDDSDKRKPGGKVAKEAGGFHGMGVSRRGFLKGTIAGLSFAVFNPFHHVEGSASIVNPLFWIKNIPDQPFSGGGGGNYHVGVDYLLYLMGDRGLKFYRSIQEGPLSGPTGMIEANDIVLIKVNAQWKYRGCTNSDLIRGLIQRILDHPDGYTGEVVIFENGQGRGSLNCNTSQSYSGDTSVHANANDESHSFNYLVNTIFDDPRVSSFLLDPIRGTFIGANDHATNGYRKYDKVSYPCFTTAGNHRVELMEGLWQEGGYGQNLKLINVPVLKHHDTGGSEITASLKHFYGVVSMSDGQSPFRHYGGLGETSGKMMVWVRTPVLNIIDAIWVCHASLRGYPASATYRANQILASQDPVALDYWAAKHILYPIDGNSRHHPGFPGIDQWLTEARDTINNQGGLSDPNSGILVGRVTKNEREMWVHEAVPAPHSIAISLVVIDADTSAIKYCSWYPPGFYGFIPHGGSSSESPAVAVFMDREYMATKGRATNNIFLRYQDNTGNFSPWATISGSTSKSPALAAFNNRLYMAVKESMTNNIFLRSMDASGTWDTSWTQISGATSEAPALTVFNNRLYLFIKEAVTNTISYQSMGTSGDWDGWSTLSGGTTTKSIGLTAFNNELYMFVKDAATNKVFYRSMAISGNWSPWMTLSGQTTEAPSVAVLEDRLYVATKGKATNNAFIRSMDLSGNWDSSWTMIPANTNKTPVLSTF